MKTQQELEKLSDDELNEEICKILYPDCSFKFINLSDVTGRRMMMLNFIGFEIDNYCNSIADMWPLILENKISIEFRDHKSLDPTAKRFNSNSHSVAHENILRAAAIVYILLKQEQSK